MFRYLHTSHQGGHVKVALVFRFGTPVPEKVRLRRAGSTHKNSHRSQLASGIYCDCLCSEKPANINTLSCARLLLAPLVTVDVSSMLTWWPLYNKNRDNQETWVRDSKGSGSRTWSRSTTPNWPSARSSPSKTSTAAGLRLAPGKLSKLSLFRHC